MNDCLIAKKVNKIYNEKTDHAFTALKQVDLGFEENEFIAIMGPNGSGKTTLINIIGMLDICSSGYIKIKNENAMVIALDHYSKNKKIKIGTVLQKDYLINEMTVYANLEIPLFLQNMKDKKKRIQEVSEWFQITDLLDKYPFQCSTGQKMKISIARAIIHSPALVIADEPTGNLDEKSSAEIMSLFQQLHRQGLTIIMVTHQTNIAAYCNRCIFLFEGSIQGNIVRNDFNQQQFEYAIHENYDRLYEGAEQ